MKLRIAVFALLVAVATVANASKISLQGTGLLNTDFTTITLLLSGSDHYNNANFKFTINGGVGPAPTVTAIFGIGAAQTVPTGNLAGSIWSQAGNGNLGVQGGAAFGTAGFVSQNTEGVYAVLKISTIGIAPAPFILSFAGTELFNGLDEDSNPVYVPLDAPDVVISNLLTWTYLVATPSSGTSISLGSVAPSTSVSSPEAITLENKGEFSSDLRVETATLTGPHAGLFEIVGGFSQTTLLGNETADFGVRFLGAPNAGTFSAQLQFTFSGAGNPEPISYPITVTVVPEPSTYAFAAIGLAALLAIRRRALWAMN